MTAIKVSVNLNRTLEEEETMFRRILFPTDFSSYATATLGCVAELKKVGMREIVLLHVVHQDEGISGSTVDLDRVERLTREAGKTLETARIGLESQGFQVKTRVEVGVPGREIVRVAEEEDVSIIAMGSRGRGILGSFLMGSVTESVLRNARRPVWVEKFNTVTKLGEVECRRVCERAFGKILWPTDFSENAAVAFNYVKELLEAGVEEVVLLHVQDERAMRHRTAEEIAEFDRIDKSRLAEVAGEMERLGIAAKVRLEHGHPVARTLDVAEAEDVGCIVMGSHGRSAIAEVLLGGTTDNVVHQSRRPVLVVRREMLERGV